MIKLSDALKDGMVAYSIKELLSVKGTTCKCGSELYITSSLDNIKCLNEGCIETKLSGLGILALRCKDKINIEKATEVCKNKRLVEIIVDDTELSQIGLTRIIQEADTHRAFLTSLIDRRTMGILDSKGIGFKEFLDGIKSRQLGYIMETLEESDVSYAYEILKRLK